MVSVMVGINDADGSTVTLVSHLAIQVGAVLIYLAPSIIAQR